MLLFRIVLGFVCIITLGGGIFQLVVSKAIFERLIGVVALIAFIIAFSGLATVEALHRLRVGLAELESKKGKPS